MSEQIGEQVKRKPALPARSQSRRAVVQAMYQWQLNPDSQPTLEQQFLTDPAANLGNREFFVELLRGLLAEVDEIDALFAPALDRPITQLNPVELSVLRLGVYELRHKQDIPYRVIINEAIELAKTFGSEGGHAYVNGVLDKVAKTVRATELAAKS